MKKLDRTAVHEADRVLWACAAVAIGLLIGVGTFSARVEAAADSGDYRWHIVDYALSPSGKNLAEIVRVRRDGKTWMDVVLRDPNHPELGAHTVFRGLHLSSVEWLNSRAIAFVSSGDVTKIIMEEIASDHVTRLLKTHEKISRILPDPKEDWLAYSYVSSNSSGDYNDAPSVKVADGLMILNLILPKKHPAIYRMTFHVGILRWNVRGGRRLARWKCLWTSWTPGMAWVGGRLMVLTHGLSGYQSSVVNVRTGKVVDVDVPGNWIYFLTSRHRRIAVVSTMSHNLTAGSKGLQIFVRNRAGRVHAVSAGKGALISGLWFRSGHRLIAQVVGWHSGSAESQGRRRLTGLVEVDWSNDRILRTYSWPHGTLGAWPHVCRVDLFGNRAVCVAQTLRDPPMLVSIDLNSGMVHKLGYLRSGARRLSFKFRRLVIRNSFGSESSNFLALPKGWRQHGVPLAVMTYGFGRQYSRYGQWITSYPVARLVHAGIAVLLVNFPKERPWRKGDFAAAFREEIQEPLSTVVAAVPAVRRAGVRVTRAMIMGWSQGGLVSAFAIQDLHQFVAAQVGDPEEWTVTSFSLGSSAWRRLLERQFGGPPDRRYIDRYLDFDPISDGRPAHGPILFEFVRRNVAEGQFLEEWRAAGTHVEAFAYRNSNHALNVPAEAKISRERNLDWAKLNLLGPHSVSRAELRRVGLTIPVNGWWSRGRRGAVHQKPDAPNLEARVRRSGRRTTGIEQCSRSGCRGAARIAEHFGPRGLAEPAVH